MVTFRLVLALPLVLTVLGSRVGGYPGYSLGADAAHAAAKSVRPLAFSGATGTYNLSFAAKSGAITIRPKGSKAGISLTELGGSKKLNVLRSATSVKRQSSGWAIRGRAPWTSFTLTVGLPTSAPGLIHVRLTLKPFKDAPMAAEGLDARVVGANASTLTEYAPAPPVAGTSVFLSDTALNSSILYLADLTSLGQYFQRTGSGGTQAIFTYPRAGTKGALVGAGQGSFGYVAPAVSLQNLPHGKSTVVVDSYLYLHPGVPGSESSMAETYLSMLDAVYAQLPRPSIPTPDWKALAAKTATDLSDPANLVTVNGLQYLRSYVSDTRTAPELITQVGVLAGLKAYENRFQTSIPLAGTLDANLPSFYDPVYHTIVNGLGHDPQARGESWYFVQNMISLLQLAQLGDTTARKLLLDSVDAVAALAHANNYEFPTTFQYGVWTGAGSDLQPDVAGGYAWLMLGLHDLTGDSQYLDEAKASIDHIAGKGFNLAYETQMSAYAAAAAERLYSLTGIQAYRGDALLALANLFHATRLWDCRYGLCVKGSGYHTYFGLNPLPWSDYVAMLEQYEAWLGLKDYLQWAQAAKEPAYVTDLVQAFITYSPLTMQYSLPPLLPAGAASPAAGEYDFVPHNNLSWNIPLEDLREGEATSGSIGQEIYGAGGPFMFAAYGP